jgi:hypothetical protein
VVVVEGTWDSVAMVTYSLTIVLSGERCSRIASTAAPDRGAQVCRASPAGLTPTGAGSAPKEESRAVSTPVDLRAREAASSSVTESVDCAVCEPHDPGCKVKAEGWQICRS